MRIRGRIWASTWLVLGSAWVGVVLGGLLRGRQDGTYGHEPLYIAFSLIVAIVFCLPGLAALLLGAILISRDRRKKAWILLSLAVAWFFGEWANFHDFHRDGLYGHEGFYIAFMAVYFFVCSLPGLIFLLVGAVALKREIQSTESREPVPASRSH